MSDVRLSPLCLAYRLNFCLDLLKGKRIGAVLPGLCLDGGQWRVVSATAFSVGDWQGCQRAQMSPRRLRSSSVQ